MSEGVKTLYLERSTGGSRDGNWSAALDLEGVRRIVVGTGPGSFAGIRAALAFAQGYALGRECEVLGLPSPCAVAADAFAADPSLARLAVVGDARQGKIWIAEFEGFRLVKDVYQVDASALAGALPATEAIVTSDDARIGASLTATFGERYLGGRLPTAEGLRRFAEACPSILKAEPLPIYLNPAVRT